MKIRFIFNIILILFVIVMPIAAQSPMALYYMETIPQASFVNPAMQPRANGFIALPGSNFLLHSDLAFNNIFQDIGNNEYVSPISSRYNYNKLYRATGKSTSIIPNIDLNVLGFGFRYGKDYFTFGFGVKSNMQFGLPTDMFKILENGFPHGQKLDLSTFRMRAMAYKEFSFGYSRQWDDLFTFGVSVKPLFGMMAAETNIKSFSLLTTRTQWDLNVNGSVHSSAPFDVIEGENEGDFPDSIEDRELSDNDVVSYFTSFKNPGIAFDLGSVYQHNDDWSFSAALTNLGFITWKEDLNSLSFKGSYTFDGINIDESNKDDLDDEFEAVVDSIKDIIDFNVGHKKFSSGLTPGLYLGASYHFNHFIDFGFLSRSLFEKYNFRQDFNLSANIQPYSFVALNLNYSLSLRGANGIGGGFTILAGPLQLYLLADYIPIYYSEIYFDDEEDSFPMFPKQKELSLKFGLNLTFGRNGYQDSPMIRK